MRVTLPPAARHIGAPSAAGALLAAALLLAAPARAQQLGSAVIPETITVGDIFHAVVRVADAGPAAVAFPDTLVLPAELELAGRRRVVRDTVNGRERWTALYPLTGWRPGQHTLPTTTVQLLAGEGLQTASVRFPAVVIRSVLPADTAGLQPQPPHDVLGANRVWWPFLLAALVALALAAAGLWWYRRRQGRRPEVLPAVATVPPREAALAALDRIRRSGALEQGAYRRFYSDVSETLRGFVAALDPQLGPDLTTSELAARTRATGREGAARELIAVLQAADLVKFARRRATADAALADWERARGFVETFAAPAEPEQRAA